MQPGARYRWHTRYGPVIVNVVAGSLTCVDTGTCHETMYAPGQAFVDAGHGHEHSAYIPATPPTVFIATFFELHPRDGALLIPETLVVSRLADSCGRPMDLTFTGLPRGTTGRGPCRRPEQVMS